MPGTARSTFILILVDSPALRGALGILPPAAPDSLGLRCLVINHRQRIQSASQPILRPSS